MTNRIILLVEDNPDDEELILRSFRRSHVLNEVIVARDGEEALDYLLGMGKFSGRDLNLMPQVVLLDLKLPKVGGLEVLERMRREPHTAMIPVVILTSSSEEEDILASYKLGANSYVRKPVEFQHFAEAVQQVGLYWMLVNSSPPAPN